MVTATECKTCIRILEKNIEFNIADETKWLTKDQIVVKQCNWGENIVDESLKNTMYDLIVLSDLVFIAVRDSIMNEFIDRNIQLAKPQTQMLLIYEERILQGEAEFLDKLKEYFDFKIFELDSELLEWLESTTDDDDGGMDVEGDAMMAVEEEEAVAAETEEVTAPPLVDADGFMTAGKKKKKNKQKS